MSTMSIMDSSNITCVFFLKDYIVKHSTIGIVLCWPVKRHVKPKARRRSKEGTNIIERFQCFPFLYQLSTIHVLIIKYEILEGKESYLGDYNYVQVV